MNTWWYLTRATGLVAWFAMGLSMLVGIVLSTRLFPERRRPAWLLDVHRWVSGISIVALGVHLGSLVADSYVDFGFLELTVPYASAWRPGAVALGVVAVWLLVLVSATAALRRRLPRRVWLWIHRSSYLGFWLASLHAAAAGTDAANPAYRVGAVLLLTLVLVATVYRVAVTEPPRRRGPRLRVPVPPPAPDRATRRTPDSLAA